MLSFAEAPKCKIQDAHKVTLYHCDNTALYSYSSFKKNFFCTLHASFLDWSFQFCQVQSTVSRKNISYSLSLGKGVISTGNTIID